MSRLLSALLTTAIFATALLPLGCGEEEQKQEVDAGPPPVGEQNCVDEIDDDGDGKIDCDDDECAIDVACKPPEPLPCGNQKQCGDIVEEIVVNVCVDQKCVAPGPFHPRTGEAIEVSAIINFSFTGNIKILTNKPRSAIARLIHPKGADGTVLTCAELIAMSGSTQAERSKLDNTTNLNFVYRNLIPLEWTSGDNTFSFPSSVPRGKVILFGEAWFGQRELSQPTGSRASVYCKENVDLETLAAGGAIDYVFNIN